METEEHGGATLAMWKNVLVYMHFIYPIIAFVGFLTAFMVHSIRAAPKSTTPKASQLVRGPGGKLLPQRKKRPPSEQRELHIEDFNSVKKSFFSWITVVFAASFVVDAALIILRAITNRSQGWWCGQNGVIYVVGSFVVYVLVVMSLLETTPSPNWSHAFTWAISLAMEGVILIGSIILYIDGQIDGYYSKSNHKYGPRGVTKWESVGIGIKVFRSLCLSLLLGAWCLFVLTRSKNESKKIADLEEEAPLLNEHTHLNQVIEANASHRNGLANGHNSITTNGSAILDANSGLNGLAIGGGKTYGTMTEQVSAEEQTKDGWVRPKKIPKRGWYEYLRSYSLFFPYLWPSKSARLQLIVIFCFLLVLTVRLINVYVPQQAGKIVNQLTSEGDETIEIPWLSILIYIFLRSLQGNNGILGALRSYLWIPVSQYSYRELATAAFEHVHGLSLDFHLNKKTGEVISALNKGGSINNFLETVTFNLTPMLIDMVIAIFYFLSAYDAYYAITLFVMVIAYIFVTIRMTQTRTHQRRIWTDLDREEEAVKNDSLMSYETVKYFNAEDREFNRYKDAVKAVQRAEYKVMFSLQTLNVSQMGIFMVGLLITCMVAAFQVSQGNRDVGSFVTLITYMTQLQAPLNYFGTFFRSMQSAMINAERLLELFKQQPTVVDAEGAEDLVICNGEIKCDDVQFAYDKRNPALKGVSFTCAPGTSTALVGESGGGKSTMFRLLFRFYNLNGGSIEVDGHDVRDITVDSLRRHIGVVPQDTILFNETIMYNLKYANPLASDTEIFDACKAACIHEKIIGFPDGYNTKVGERGLKLSGGEKQRIAIARTIIKNPRIILLDEATAALDTDTEDHIQRALSNLQEDRTTLIIAHRLSTITKCDQILVLNDGRIVEVGTHDELVESGGRYARLWNKQMRATKAYMESVRFLNKAKRLENKGADSPSASQSEDERGGAFSSSAPTLTNKKLGGGGIRSHRRQGSNLAKASMSVDDADDDTSSG